MFLWLSVSPITKPYGGTLVILFTLIVAVFLIGKLKSRELLAHALEDATGLYQRTLDSVMDAIRPQNACLGIRPVN